MGFVKKVREEFRQMVENQERYDEIRARAERVKRIQEENAQKDDPQD